VGEAGIEPAASCL